MSGIPTLTAPKLDASFGLTRHWGSHRKTLARSESGLKPAFVEREGGDAFAVAVLLGPQQFSRMKTAAALSSKRYRVRRVRISAGMSERPGFGGSEVGSAERSGDACGERIYYGPDH